MNNLEKILKNLPKQKLSLTADLKIKLKLYYFILLKNLTWSSNPLAQRKLIFRNSLVAALIIVVMFSGTSIYAYGNNDIMPGQSLYILKRAVEKMEEQIPLSNTLKVQTFQKFSERRLEEALHLSQEHLLDSQSGKKDEVSGEIQKNIDEAVNNIVSAVNKVNEIKDESRAEAAKNIFREKENKEVNYLDEIKKNASLEHDSEVIEKIDQAKETIRQSRKTLEDKEPKREKGENGDLPGYKVEDATFGSSTKQEDFENREIKNYSAEEQEIKKEDNEKINIVNPEESRDKHDGVLFVPNREINSGENDEADYKIREVPTGD